MKYKKFSDDELEALRDSYSLFSDEQIEITWNLHLNALTHESEAAKIVKEVAATRGITLYKD